MDGNREPDEAEEKVEQEDEDREAEDALVPFRREVIDRDRYDQHQFGDGPDERSPFDVAISGTTGKVNVPYCELRYNVIRCCLQSVLSSEHHKGTDGTRGAIAIA